MSLLTLSDIKKNIIFFYECHLFFYEVYVFDEVRLLKFFLENNCDKIKNILQLTLQIFSDVTVNFDILILSFSYYMLNHRHN